MIHRAPFGSMERFIGILIEHFAGAFPLWLAPVQVGIASVSEKSAEYAEGVEKKLAAAGLRVESDTSSEKIGPKKHRFRARRIRSPGRSRTRSSGSCRTIWRAWPFSLSTRDCATRICAGCSGLGKFPFLSSHAVSS
jgi:hypothetical protein